MLCLNTGWHKKTEPINTSITSTNFNQITSSFRTWQDIVMSMCTPNFIYLQQILLSKHAHFKTCSKCPPPRWRHTCRRLAKFSTHPNGNKSITMDSILFKLGEPLNKTKKHTYTTNQINRLIKSCLTGYQCSQSVRGSTLDLWQKSNQIWTSINQQRWSVINWHFVKCLSRNTAMCLIT